MRKALWVLAGGSALAGGCIYDVQLALPENMRRISVPLLSNETTIFGLDTDLTQAVRRKLMEDGRVQVVDADQGPQGELAGAVTQYAREPIELDPATNKVYKWRLRLQARIELSDVAKKQVLWKEPQDQTRLPFDAAYEYFEIGNPRGMRPEAEGDGRRRVVEELARRIVSRTLDGW